jgi:hypothetical protein
MRGISMFKCFQNDLLALIVKTKEELEQAKKYMDFTKIEEVTNEDFEIIGGIYYVGNELLNKYKNDKKQEINQAREQARLDEGAEYNNDLFDIDENSLSIITAKMTLAKENTEKTFVYRSKTNQNHEFLGSDIINIWQKINDKIESIYQKSWDLKTKIDNATTREELEAITW